MTYEEALDLVCQDYHECSWKQLVDKHGNNFRADELLLSVTKDAAILYSSQYQLPLGEKLATKDQLQRMYAEYQDMLLKADTAGFWHEQFQMANAEREQLKKRVTWQPASEAPYDEPCIFRTVEGHAVEGFIYDGDESDFGYTHYVPMPDEPLDGLPPAKESTDSVF